MVTYALSFIGVPYIWGGSNPIRGFDCSGFCLELLKSIGFVSGSFDTTAKGIHNMLSDGKRGEELALPQRGAFVFYGPSKLNISHIGFCLDAVSMIEAGGGDSAVKDKSAAEARDAFVRIRPIKSRKDLIGFAIPYY